MNCPNCRFDIPPGSVECSLCHFVLGSSQAGEKSPEDGAKAPPRSSVPLEPARLPASPAPPQAPPSPSPDPPQSATLQKRPSWLGPEAPAPRPSQDEPPAIQSLQDATSPTPVQERNQPEEAPHWGIAQPEALAPRAEPNDRQAPLPAVIQSSETSGPSRSARGGNPALLKMTILAVTGSALLGLAYHALSQRKAPRMIRQETAKREAPASGPMDSPASMPSRESPPAPAGTDAPVPPPPASVEPAAPQKPARPPDAGLPAESRSAPKTARLGDDVQPDAWGFHGLVYDMISLDVIPGASLLFSEPDNPGRGVKIRANSKGRYRARLPPLGRGGYLLKVRHPDYKDHYFDEVEPPYREQDLESRRALQGAVSTHQPWIGNTRRSLRRDVILFPDVYVKIQDGEGP